MSDLYSRLSKDDAAVLLVDHQTGLISGLVRDYGVDEFKNNVLALGDTAKFFDLPVILTTSFENGPNGPLMQELVDLFPNAPKIARPGQINAWDNEEFVKAIKATGKKQLIIAGVYITLDKGRFQFRLFTVAFFTERTDDQGRLSRVLRKHQGGYFMQRVIHTCIFLAV